MDVTVSLLHLTITVFIMLLLKIKLKSYVRNKFGWRNTIALGG